MSTYGDSFDSSASSSSANSSSHTSSSSLQQKSNETGGETRRSPPAVPIPFPSSVPVPVPVPVPVAAAAPVVNLQMDCAALEEVVDANEVTLPSAALPLLSSDVNTMSIEPVQRSPRKSETSKTLVNTSSSVYEAPADAAGGGNSPAFHTLSNYVAFNQSSEGSAPTEGANTSSLTRTRELGADGDEKESGKNTHADHKLPSQEATEVVEATPNEDASTVDASSVFSTLSQHLKTVKHGQQQINPTSAVAVSNNTLMERNTDVSNTAGDAAQELMNANAATSATAVPPPSIELPLLPTSAESPSITMDIPPPSVLLSAIPPVPDRLTFTAPHPQTGTIPPPLPPAPSSGSKTVMIPGIEGTFTPAVCMPPPPPPGQSREAAVNSRILELRETSEAVEKLVRAFALLRGHGSSATGEEAEKKAKVVFTPTEVAGMSSRRQEHGVGDSATVKEFQALRRPPLRTYMPKLDHAKGDENEKATQQMNEAAVEEAILGLVMEMMQRDTERGSKADGCRRFIQPACELVAMDDFRYSDQRSSKRRQPLRGKAAPLSVFGGGMQAFAPDDIDAAESLYHSVIEALGKYVWSHVEESPLRGERLNFPPASAHFALAVQLDLLSVCLQAIETRLTHRGNVADGAVWIQYDGSRESEPLARNAAHCLPFESIDLKSSGRPVFRLEYWVTRENMWAVVEALIASVRGGVVRSGDGYCVFNAKGGTYMDPNTVFPTRVPCFSLLPRDPSRPSCDEKSPPRGKKLFAHASQDDDVERGGEEEMKPRADLFYLEQSALQSLAHVVSCAGTEIIEEDKEAARGDYAQYYSDATCGVVEAVRELLEDASIRAAVKRRAKAKMRDMAQRRETEGKLNREDRERSIIAAAEAEAERVVQRILHELHVEEARDQR